MTKDGSTQDDPHSVAPDAAPEVAAETPDGVGLPESSDSEQAMTMPAAAKAKLDKKKTIIGGIVTLIILGLVFWGLSKQFGSFSDAWDKMQQMSGVAVASLILVVVVNILVYAFPLMPAIPNLKYWPSFMVRQTAWMITALVPAGGAVALGSQYLMLASYRITPAAATSGIAINSVFSFMMTFLLPVLGVLSISATGEVQAAWLWTGVAGLAVLIVLIVVFWLILRSESSARRVGEVGQKLASPIMRRLHKDTDITESILSFRDQVVDVVKARWISLTVSNLAVSFMQFMILFVAVRGVSSNGGSEVSFVELFAAFAISRLASLIPVTPGGLGTVAGALGAILAVFGLSSEDILASVLTWQVAQLVPQAATGIATMLIWRVQDSRRVKASATA